jgi:hypothetical protein
MRAIAVVLIVQRLCILGVFGQPTVGLPDRHQERMMKALRNPAARPAAEAAYQQYKSAKGGVQQVDAFLKLFEVDDPAAKMTVVSLGGGSKWIDEHTSKIQLKVEDLPWLADWMVEDSLKGDEPFGSWDVTGARFGHLERLGEKFVGALHTKAPIAGFLSPPLDDLEKNYERESIIAWLKHQIETSLTEKSWSKEEQDTLRSLLVRLASLPSVEPGAVQQASSAVLPQPQTSTVMPPEPPSSRPWLWAGAGIGMLLLVFLALRHRRKSPRL